MLFASAAKPILRVSHAQLIFFVVILTVAFCFGVIYSGLTIYFTNVLGFSIHSASEHYETFVTWLFAASVLGGFLGSSFGHFRVSIVSLTVIVLAILTLNLTHYIYLAMALFAVGLSFILANVGVMLGQLFLADDLARPRAFVYNYIAMNSGVFAGSLFAGTVSVENIHLIFIPVSLLILFNIFVLLYFYRRLPFQSHSLCYRQRADEQVRTWSLVLLVAVIAATVQLLQELISAANQSNAAIFSIFTLVISILILYAILNKRLLFEQRLKIFLFLGILLPTALFYVLYTIEQSVLVSFYDRAVSHQWLGITLPPTFLGGLNAVFNLLFGILFVVLSKKLRKTIATDCKVFLGIVFMGLAYVILSVFSHAAVLNNVDMSFVGIIIVFLVLSFSEMIIAPIDYSLPSQYGPSNMQGYMFGTVHVLMGASAGFSILLSNSLSVNKSTSVSSYNQIISTFSFDCGAITMVSGLILLALSYFVRLIYRHYQTIRNT